MLEVRNGTGETLGVLFDRYHAPLYNFYSKLTGDRTLSEDLVQEVFLADFEVPAELSAGNAVSGVDLPDCEECTRGSLPKDAAAHHVRAGDGGAGDAERFRAAVGRDGALAPGFDANAGRETGDSGVEPVSGIEI